MSSDDTIILVDGKKIFPLGRIQTEICIGTRNIYHSMLVADIGPDARLGLDFFRRNRCQLDFGNNELIIGETSVTFCQNKPQNIFCQGLKLSKKPPLVIGRSPRKKKRLNVSPMGMKTKPSVKV